MVKVRVRTRTMVRTIVKVRTNPGISSGFTPHFFKSRFYHRY